MGKSRSIGLLLYALPLVAAAVARPSPCDAAACSARSPAHTVALVELYTSEGCSSCPPADRWLNALKTDGIAPEEAAPLALHVDYWNNLGWRDPFSQRAFSHRQERLATLDHLDAVYTPQVVVQGRDQRLWYNSATFERELTHINKQPPMARIKLSLTMDGKDRLRAAGSASLASTYNAGGTGVYLALYQNHLTSRIKGGENAGKTLHHNFVVRQLVGPLPIDQTLVTFSRIFTLKPQWPATDLGVTAFVQNTDNGDVLQAVSLPLCPTLASSINADH